MSTTILGELQRTASLVLEKGQQLMSSLILFISYFLIFRSRKPRLTALGIRCADHAMPSILKFGTNFANKRRSVEFACELMATEEDFVIL
jgi:hypothetical protein